MPGSKEQAFLPCDRDQPLSGKSLKKHLGLPDWPLSREEKKGQVMQLFQRDLRAADKIIHRGEHALEKISTRVDALSTSLRTIISEASQALGDVEGLDAQEKKQRRARAKSQDVPRKKPQSSVKTSFKDEPTPKPSQRISFGEEPEKEPADNLGPAEVLTCNVLMPQADHETMGSGKASLQDICSVLSGRSASPVFDTSTATTIENDDPPADFLEFCQAFFLGPSNPKPVFLKTE